MARKFFYVCAGVFLLSLSYHLGATSAHATGPVQVEIVRSSPNAFMLAEPIHVNVDNTVDVSQ